MKLISLLVLLAFQIKNRKLKDQNISEAAISWHISHTLLVINNVVNTLIASNPDDYVKTENRIRENVLNRKEIKRGVAKSPKAVDPGTETKKHQIKYLLDQAKVNSVKLKLIPKNAHFTHPTMGMLNKKEAIKFLKIHTKHHLHIIDEIVGP